MLCIKKKIETESGAVAYVWIPTLLRVESEKRAVLSLSGKVIDTASVAVAAIDIPVDIDKVHTYDRLLKDVEQELVTGAESFLVDGRGTANIDGVPYKKKSVPLKNGITATLWKRLDFMLDFNDECGRAFYVGYRDADAVRRGESPVTGRQPYKVSTNRMLKGPNFRNTQRQLLDYLCKKRGCKLFGGAVGVIDA